MTAPGAGLRIAEVARVLLDQVSSYFDAADFDDTPMRRILAAGDPQSIAWDCEQIVVSLAGVGWGWAVDLSSQSPKVAAHMNVAGMRHAVYSVQVVMCQPKGGQRTGGKPDDSAIDDAGYRFMRAAGILSQALVSTVTTLKLGPDGHAQAGAIEPLGPDGGYAAIEGTLSITSGDLA